MNTNFTKVLPSMKPVEPVTVGGKTVMQSAAKTIIEPESSEIVRNYEDLTWLINIMKENDASQSFDKNEPALSEKEVAIDTKWNELRNKINGTLTSRLKVENGLSALPFYDALKFIEEEGSDEKELFTSIQAMPKGGNLHIHSSATYNIKEFLNDLATGVFQDNIYIMMSDFCTIQIRLEVPIKF